MPHAALPASRYLVSAIAGRLPHVCGPSFAQGDLTCSSAGPEGRAIALLFPEGVVEVELALLPSGHVAQIEHVGRCGGGVAPRAAEGVTRGLRARVGPALGRGRVRAQSGYSD